MTSVPRSDLTAYLGRTVRVIIDRSLGTAHPRHADVVYPVNYGYLPGTVSGDGHPVDAYVLGSDAAVVEATGRVVAVVLRANDAEDKLIVVMDGSERAADELAAAVAFQERFFDSRVTVDASAVY